ncbi:MAG: cell division protein FtsL [Phreatobacter sp.]|uniref:cell division protein FtsL n=1 Tax=Phreatobacter sp. TaxID=1966341 RepID=UPI004036DFAC
MMRLLNIVVVAALIVAAAYVYRIKYEATRHAEQVARLQLEIKRERETIAALKAQWAQLNSPDRLQALAEKHLRLRPLAINQLHDLAGLPDKPFVDPDPIGSMLEALGSGADPVVTGSVPGMPLPQRRPAGGR